MKKLLLTACVAVLGVAACSSGNTKDADGNYYTVSSSSDNKYQIIDQEFDNMLAPEADYDSIPAYELQACGDSYLPPASPALKGATKPTMKKAVKKSSKTAAKKASSSSSSTSSSTDVTTNKKVINNTNIYYINSDAPASSSSTTTYTSEEALPDTL